MITRTRKLVIGVDEAGYGPNLGPLCFGFSVWLVDSALDIPSLARLLLPIFQPRSSDAKLPWIPLGDSKKLYKPGHSLSSLSLGIAALEHLAVGPSKATRPLDPLQDRVLKEDWDRLNRVPWYQVNGALADSLHPVLQERIPASLLEEGGWKLKAIHCELLAISSRAIEEATFNELVERMGNKSNLLTAVTLETIRQILHDRLDSKNDFDSIEIFCDKHGGRNRYVAALSHYFPDCWFEVVDESTAVSRYRSEMDGRSVRWSFTAKGDDMVPTSVASMLAKWTREAYMEKLNRFWSNLLPELRPTAGYPVDAKRFALEIESQARQLGFEKKSWWRMV